MTENVEFLNPRLVGDRFADHAIPLEVLKDLSALEELIVEVAKWHFLQENSERKRIPKGFAEQVSLKITEIGEGSAIPKIVLSIASITNTLFPVDHRDSFEKARESIIAAVDAAEKGESIAGILKDNHLAYFDRIGRSLRSGESLELNYADPSRPARLNKITRRNLTLAASSVQEYTDEVNIRGTICEADQRKGRFELQLIDQSVIRAPIQSEHLETILDAFNRYKSGIKVAIDGVGVFDRRSKLVELESVEHISLLDPMDVASRLDEFRTLKNGWFEGKGVAPKSEHLDWLADQFESNYPDNLASPYLYPTAEGGVQAEWSLGTWETTLEIDLLSKKAYWHAMNTASDDDVEKAIDLGQLDGWKWIAEEVTRVAGSRSQ